MPASTYNHYICPYSINEVFSVEYKHEADYASEGKVRLLLGQNVKDMDAFRKAALLEDGRIVFYEKALLATGGEPRALPGAPKHPHITTFRTVSSIG